MSINRCVFAILAVGLQCGAASADSPMPAQAEAERPLVVVNYFAGWWEELPNKWHGRGWNDREPDWRPDFPDRVPLLGEYNDQATMDREIATAADYGVDAFAILWYYPKPGSRQEKYAPRLNKGLDTFLNSENAERMRFFIEYCNSPDFSAVGDEQWADCVATWVDAMKHPAYLRVDGRLVFKVHGITQFLLANDNDLDLCRQRLDTLRDAVRNAGLGEMIIGVGISGETPPLGAKWPPAELFDFTATYMCVPKIEEREAEYPYATLAAQARSTLRNRLSDPLPWVPYVAAGWNPRPWTHANAADHYQRFFDFPTREEFTEELKAMKGVFVEHPSLGLPRRDGTRQPIFTIYAWNEFGEGGIVAPTKGRGHMMLECIKDVFGTSASHRSQTSSSPLGKHAPDSRRPNVIVILADDLGYADLGCHGSPDVKTPHIDSLAEDGVRCTAAYVTAPQCGPSRAAILTGRYQNRFGFESNEFAYSPGLPLSETLISDRMKTVGYATGYVGKWGVSSKRHSRPPQRGFDESYWNQDGNLYFPDTPSRHNVQMHRDNDPVEQPAYSTDAFGREAVAFIQRHKDEPFFLFVSFITPHVPMEAKPEDLARFTDAGDPLRRTMLAMVACMDDNVGRILETLKEEKLEEDTLIIFLSDNGGYPGNASRNNPFSGGKSQMLEGGIREPFILQWKGRLPAGTVYDQPVISLDIVPTALAAVGVQVDPAWKLDGVNLLPFLSSDDAGTPHEALFWRFNFPLESPDRYATGSPAPLADSPSGERPE